MKTLNVTRKKNGPDVCADVGLRVVVLLSAAVRLRIQLRETGLEFLHANSYFTPFAPHV